LLTSCSDVDGERRGCDLVQLLDDHKRDETIMVEGACVVAGDLKTGEHE
jgi:hypothetical protein